MSNEEPKIIIDTHNPENPVGLETPALPTELVKWQERLRDAGVICKDIAFLNVYPWGSRDFTTHPALKDLNNPANVVGKLSETWQSLTKRLSAQQPVALARHGSDLVAVYLMSEWNDKPAIIGCLIAAPYNDKIIQIIQLALGWLQIPASNDVLIRSHRAAQLLEMLGHVLSQETARAGAQDWINRTIAWIRTERPDIEDMSLSLFTVTRGVPKWYVSSDVALAEKGSPIMQSALEVAARAIVEFQEQHTAEWWACPLLDAGHVRGVLLARHQEYKELLPAPVLDIFRASSSLAEPILRHWQKAERPLWQHVAASIVVVYRKLTGSGYLTWKVAVVAGLLILAVLTFWPVNDLVKADLVIEGKTRWVITAPEAGFLATVAVRPGDHVKSDQLLATLDTRDLLVEQAKQQSASDQADGHLRKAMGEGEAADSAQAVADLHQAQAQLALVESKLSRSMIKAPMTGIVVSGDWTQQIGSPVENGKELFQIAEDGSYRAILHVLDSDIARVHVGQEGHLRLTSLPAQTFDFSVTRVTAMASVQANNNGFRVEAKWVGDVPKLSPGMQGVGKVIVGQTNLITKWTRPLINWLRMKLWGIV